MDKIGKIFKRSPSIHHFKLSFPLYHRRYASSYFSVEQCIRKVYDLSPKKSQGIFLSLNGHTENPQTCQILYDSFAQAQSKHRIPVYTFLQDKISSLTYFTGTAGSKIVANPYCLMGDIIVPTKNYFNIRKLLQFFGIQIERVGTKDISLWNKIIDPTPHEKQFTSKWLSLIENGLIENISIRRSIPKQKVAEIGKRLMSPKQALENKLIDKIATMQQYKTQHFPNHQIIENEYTLNTGDRSLTPKEIQVLLQIKERMEMSNVGLMSIEDPMNEIVRNIVQIVEERLQDPAKLSELDGMLGRLFEELQTSIQNKEIIM